MANHCTLNAREKAFWPAIFDNPALIATTEPRALCAECICAWALCMSGNTPPESFGKVLVMAGERLGVTSGATAENLVAFAVERGWLTTAPSPETAATVAAQALPLDRHSDA